MSSEESTDNGLFESDFLGEIRTVIQDIIPYLIGYKEPPRRLPNRIVVECDRQWGRDWIDEETACKWIDDYWNAATLTFDYSSLINTEEAFFGPAPGEINPFAEPVEYAKWMFAVGAACLLLACPGMLERWHSLEFELDFLTSITLWYLLEYVDLDDATIDRLF